MKENPFSLNFGIEPSRLISRESQIGEIVQTFSSDTPSSYIYMITGVRGSGKTVTMASAANRLKNRADWIVIPLNPNRDLLHALAANLYEHPILKPAFTKAEFGFSLGVTASVRTEGPSPDVEAQIRKMLSVVKTLKKRILITVDEVINCENIRIFASSYQMFLSEKFPLFLLMTGLYEQIRNLQNEKNLTFLYRAPKIELKPLSVNGMANNYREVFDITEYEALEMAKFTMGYSYAFQVLGYLKFRMNTPLQDLIPMFDEIMEEYVYEKIWEELSARDREIAVLLAKKGKMKVQDILNQTGLTSSSFSTYRRRLSKGGIISVQEYGYCELCLPRFREIILTFL